MSLTYADNILFKDLEVSWIYPWETIRTEIIDPRRRETR